MQLDTQGQNPRSAITSEERARRQAEVDFARGSVRYEGGTLPDDIERINTRYIAGEIDSGELTVAILSSHTVNVPYLQAQWLAGLEAGNWIPASGDEGSVVDMRST